jgi:hypothetical protein
MRKVCCLVIPLSLLAFGPTAAFANSDNPKCGAFDCTTTTTGTHGGSNNTCTVGTDGCNTVTTTTTKQNNGGNNQTNTNTCTSPNKNVC